MIIFSLHGGIDNHRREKATESFVKATSLRKRYFCPNIELEPRD